ncbi:ThuA domain-containing protein [Planctomycetales bacterium ZRK34]|nr:ThuA domain-containing protein [Planctomycetales bacterium ZRK34]
MQVMIVFALALVASVAGFTTTQSQARAADIKPLKVLLVIGGCCHDYEHQKDVLKEGLEKRANVEVTLAYDPDKTTKHLNPVFESADWASGYDVIIHDECSANVADLKIIDRILKPHRDGLPAVALHCALHCFRSEGWKNPETPTPWQMFMGLQSTGHGRQAPIAVNYVDKDHPIAKGLEDWVTIKEELYNNIAGGLVKTGHPLANGKQDNNESIVTWTNLYNGKSRVFATTLGHNTETVADARYLDLVTRGLLWSCGKLNDDGTPMAGYGK